MAKRAYCRVVGMHKQFGFTALVFRGANWGFIDLTSTYRDNRFKSTPSNHLLSERSIFDLGRSEKRVAYSDL